MDTLLIIGIVLYSFAGGFLGSDYIKDCDGFWKIISSVLAYLILGGLFFVILCIIELVEFLVRKYSESYLSLFIKYYVFNRKSKYDNRDKEYYNNVLREYMDSIGDKSFETRLMRIIVKSVLTRNGYKVD
jgi:hypothetical protein